MNANDIFFPPITSNKVDYFFTGRRLFKRIDDKWVELPPEEWPRYDGPSDELKAEIEGLAEDEF